MAIYASSVSRGTQRADVVSLGAISAPLQSLANDQLFVAARGARPAKGPRRPAAAQVQPMAVQSSIKLPSGQRK
jgi:hypothetical protein